MRTLRVTVSDSEYEVLQKVAEAQERSVEQLIQETLTSLQQERIETRKRLRDLPVLPGHRLIADLPSRADLYEEMFLVEGSGSQS